MQIMRFVVPDGVRFFNPDILAQNIMRAEEPGSIVSITATRANVQSCAKECNATDPMNRPHPQLIPADEATAKLVGVKFDSSAGKKAIKAEASTSQDVKGN